MGFIGIGGQGGGHLFGGAWTYVTGGYAGRKDVQVLAACDVWRDRRENAARRVNERYAEAYGQGNYRSCTPYDDFREVLARADIDAVLIATPAHWHATMAAMAAEAGKDIYCEKPTAVTIAESQALLATERIRRQIPARMRVCSQRAHWQATGHLRLPRRRGDLLASAVRAGQAAARRPGLGPVPRPRALAALRWQRQRPPFRYWRTELGSAPL